MDSFNKKQTYQLAGELLNNIQIGAQTQLEAAGMTPAIYEEVIEELERSGEIISELRLPPFDLAFIPDNTGRIPFDVYKTDTDPNSLRISCQLWGRDGSSELTLTADYLEEQKPSTLIFRLLETQ